MAADLIVFLGPPGAGKSVQSRLLAERGFCRISSGELLRQSPDDAVSVAIASGNLAPTAAAQAVLATALAEVPSQQPVVLDGFPRLLGEAKWLDTEAARLDRVLRQVFFFKLPLEVAGQRLAQRGRDDDQPQALQRKWEEFKDHTMPVIEHYRARGLLSEVDAAASVEAVAAEMELAL